MARDRAEQFRAQSFAGFFAKIRTRFGLKKSFLFENSLSAATDGEQSV